jgi:acetyl esterase/lipase
MPAAARRHARSPRDDGRVSTHHTADAGLLETRARIDATMGELPLAEGTRADDLELGGVPTVHCAPDAGGDDGHPVVLYFHGGGYRMGSATAWRSFGSHLASASGADVYVVDYRLAPEHPFPAAVDDALAAYRDLLEATDPSRLVVAGDSAGGGLAAALVLAARDAGLPAPAALIALSPWADLRNLAGSFATRAEQDQLFSKESADVAASFYLDGASADHPHASPVLGDWPAATAVLVQVGDAEVLLDDAAALAATARLGGADVDHRVFPAMPHVFQIGYPATPESVEAVEQIAGFIRRTTVAPHRAS